MATIVDARGKACPQPVIDTKNALKAHGAPVITLVDNDIARQNVEKMAAQMGLSAVSDTMEEGAFRIVIQRSAPMCSAACSALRAEPAASGNRARSRRHVRPVCRWISRLWVDRPWWRCPRTAWAAATTRWALRS